MTANSLKVDKPADKVLPMEEKDSEVKYEHIKDFSDINSGNKGKLIEFDDNFDEDVKTTGADLSNYMDSYKEDSFVVDKGNFIEQSPLRSQVEDEESYDDFKTVSFDDVASLTLPPEDDDVTINMKVEQKNPIKVILKYNDGTTCKMLKMETSQATVGRGIGNDIMFRSDSFTSRNHALFTIREDRLYLKDLNSKNGTFINSSEKVVGEVEIVESCEVKFGDAVLNVVIEK